MKVAGSLCRCVLGQKTQLYLCLSSVRVYAGYVRIVRQCDRMLVYNGLGSRPGRVAAIP